MAKKTLEWNEGLFNDLIIKINRETLFNRIKESIESEDELEELELNKDYPLSKDLFGVKIESGLLRITKFIIKDAVDMLDLLVELTSDKRGYHFNPIQDIGHVVVMTRRLGLELPDVDAVQGYILNNELVGFTHEPFSFIQLKFKDDPENIFYIYKLYFVEINHELFLVIEKNI